MTFVPTQEAQIVIDKIGLFLKKSINGLSLYCDEERFKALQLYASDPETPLRFSFKVFSNNRLFQIFTAPPVYQDQQLLYFTNSNSSLKLNSSVVLSRAEQVSHEDFLDLNSPTVRRNLSGADTLIKPDFIVDILAVGNNNAFFNEAMVVDAKEYAINFKSRETFWKYYVFGDRSGTELFVADAERKIEFEALGETSFAEGRTALAFRSKTPLPLQERSDHRFQLGERDSGPENILIRRLPVATANRINKETINGKEVSVSELYVNL